MWVAWFRRRRPNLGEITIGRQSFDDVWDALEDTPGEAASRTARSSLMIAIEPRVRGWEVTQPEAARRLGITQPRLDDLLQGKISNFSPDTLVNLAAQAGLVVRLAIAEAALSGSTLSTARNSGERYIQLEPEPHRHSRHGRPPT